MLDNLVTWQYNGSKIITATKLSWTKSCYANKVLEFIKRSNICVVGERIIQTGHSSSLRLAQFSVTILIPLINTDSLYVSISKPDNALVNHYRHCILLHNRPREVVEIEISRCLFTGIEIECDWPSSIHAFVNFYNTIKFLPVCCESNVTNSVPMEIIRRILFMYLSHNSNILWSLITEFNPNLCTCSPNMRRLNPELVVPWRHIIAGIITRCVSISSMDYEHMVGRITFFLFDICRERIPTFSVFCHISAFRLSPSTYLIVIVLIIPSCIRISPRFLRITISQLLNPLDWADKLIIFIFCSPVHAFNRDGTCSSKILQSHLMDSLFLWCVKFYGRNTTTRIFYSSRSRLIKVSPPLTDGSQKMVLENNSDITGWSRILHNKIIVLARIEIRGICIADRNHGTCTVSFFLISRGEYNGFPLPFSSKLNRNTRRVESRQVTSRGVACTICCQNLSRNQHCECHEQ